MSGQLQPMVVGTGSLASHAPHAGAEAVERARAAAEPLRGARLVHVNAAGGGGELPELLAATLPLLTDVGLEVEWRVLFGGPELSDVARQLHDGLLGGETAIGDDAWEPYLDACLDAVAALPEADVVVLHDPGTLGIAAVAGGELPGGARVAWRCHLDGSRAEPAARERVVGAAEACALVLVPDASFALEGIDPGRVRVAPPGIDPLTPRNHEPPPGLAGRALRPLGLDLERPFCCQTLRFDRWQDPHEAIEAFRLAREELPDLQLVLAGPLEADDAAGWRVVKEVTDYADREPGLLVLTSYEGIGDLELGALQRLARLALVRPLRGGFGLVASEALWKGTPVVGPTDGGVSLQVRDEVDGYLCDGAADGALRMIEILRDPGLGIELGGAGRERVRDRFLATHAVEHELVALRDTVGSR